MSNINKHLLTDLFINKSVKCNKKIYLKYYSEIWNDDSLYIKFLNSTSEILQRKYAKNIISRLNYSSDFIIPSFVFNSLIEDEIKEFNDPNGSYQGQIHYVHSVMMYILGIWIYFNHPVFHKYINIQLYNEFNQIECYHEFILLWKNIAITHDLGYVFENNVNAKKECKIQKFEDYFSKYNTLDVYVLYELTLKAVSKLIYIQMISDKSTQSISNIINKNKNKLFNNYNNNKVKIEDIFNSSDIKNYKKLWMIETLDEYKAFTSLNKYLKPIIIVKDIDENIIYIKKHDATEYYIEKESISLNNLDDDYLLEFYCFKPNYVVEDFLNHSCNKPHTYEYFTELVEHLYNKYSYEFTLSIDTSLQEEFRYTIFGALQKEFSYEDFINEGDYGISDEYEIIKAAKDSILIECEKLLDSFKFRKNTNIPPAMYKKLCNTIKNIETEKNIINNIVEKDNSSLKSKIKLFLSYYKTNYSLINSKLISKSKIKNDDNKIRINYDLFSIKLYKSSKKNNYTNTETKKLEEFITKCGIQTGIINEKTNFDDLLNYHAFHSIYDHGMTSSSILFHSILANKIIINQRTLQYPILLSLFTDEFNVNQYDTINLISMYAIILHNLYPNIYNDLFKKNFILELSDNPISYFLAFCDNLQQWDRPKTIDYSKTEIRGDYIVGSSFDLDIIDNTIYLHCNTSSFKNVAAKNRDILNEYLKDAAKFIKLDLKEY